MWSDGNTVDRQIISLSDKAPFASQKFRIPFDATGKKWVRFAVWDSAGNGAFTQPVHAAGGGIGQTQGTRRGQTPWTLIVLALVLLAALAANEHWCGRLPLPRTQS